MIDNLLIPINFKNRNTTEDLARTVTDFLVTRWTQIDKKMCIDKLFGEVTTKNLIVEGFELLTLSNSCEHTEFMTVIEKTDNKKSESVDY